MNEIGQYAKEGKTIVFMGSSGVGKSTLLNKLAGKDVMDVNEIREDDSKGKHTTTYRQLILLPSGCAVIDTPGMRELSVWEGDEGIGTVFQDVDQIAALCRYADCNHGNEPGCAVKKAIDQGHIDHTRLESYRKLLKEIRFLENKKSRKAASTQKSKRLPNRKNGGAMEYDGRNNE